MKKETVKNYVAGLVPVVMFITACNKDEKVDINSPSYKIAQSEKLTIPTTIEVPANAPKGNSRVVTYYAEGVQKYKAAAKEGVPGEFVWVFVAPQADLYDATNKKIGTHSAGPTWQLIGSTTDSIYAQHYTPAKISPVTDGSSIDWLLLKPKDGKAPTGIFAEVSYIQRIATVGGKAPATPPANISATIDVPYTAIYRFTKKNQ